MELINQHTKAIMEGCKIRARDAGLVFQDETLEYIVTNRDLLELSPKMMIPTLYDYWVHDVEVLREKGKYELYPGNPYETVINTRPAISFYNDNNPDWLNVMIFYHVLAHIDFFQNNLFFRSTWDYDFNGRALSDKRLIAKLRSEKGRYVDYVIEFARSLDNLVAYHKELSRLDGGPAGGESAKVNYYFDVFLQEQPDFKISSYIKEIEALNESNRQFGELGEEAFFVEVDRRRPEFEALFQKSLERKKKIVRDPMQYLAEFSPWLNKEENKWMKSVLQVVRQTSLFFQPQIRTKIMNEGWASYWHEKLFLTDDRIRGREVDFARVHALVTSLSRVGVNPYAIGMRLFSYIEELVDQGRYSHEFRSLPDSWAREHFDSGTGGGRDFIFQVRENMSDHVFISTFLDQDFINRHKLFVAGKRLNPARSTWEYFVKSRRAEEYRRMILDSLYHPPHIEVEEGRAVESDLYLNHHFEGKPLLTEYIPNTMIGVEYLWGGPVHLETSEPEPQVQTADQTPFGPSADDQPPPREIKWKRVLYSCRDRRVTRKTL